MSMFFVNRELLQLIELSKKPRRNFCFGSGKIGSLNAQFLDDFIKHGFHQP